MLRKWLNIIVVTVLRGIIASACVRGTGRGPDVYVSPTGSDSNDCWSVATACATVDRALSRLSDLGVVHFSAGAYPLTSSIRDFHGLTAVTFRGESSTTTTIYSPPGGGEVLRSSTGLIQIYDLAFDGRDTPSGTLLGSRGILSGTGAIVRIQDCLFNGLSRGIENNGGFLYVHGSRFTNDEIGILNSNDGSAFTTIDGSQFGANLYAIQHLTGRMRISGTTFVDNGVPPLDVLRPETVQNGDRMSISNSTFAGDVFFAMINLRDGVLDLTNVEISGGGGIGIENSGQLTADILTITGKPGGGFINAPDLGIIPAPIAELRHTVIRGSGVYGISNQGRLDIWDSVVQGNDGDGLRNVSALQIFDSAIVGNHGRGIYSERATYLTDSTISGNDQEGIYLESGELGLVFSTVADNAGGGIRSRYWGDLPGDWRVMITNSIIALNPGGSGNCSRGVEWWGFDGFNLACDVPASMTELGLGPLTGIGDTWVHPLLAGSPAIDSAIDVPPYRNCISRDQTGTGRPQPFGGRCDIGAFELAGGTPLSLEVTPMPVPAALPLFTFTQQANCRKGPNTLYDSVGFGQIGQAAQIEGLSDPAGWYYVLLPNAVNRCFVAGSTGTVTGSTDGLSVIPAPPLPVAPVAPAAPVLNVSNQICDATQYVVRLSWKDVDGEDGYRVYRDGALLATLGSGATSYNDASPDYSPHEYFAEAFNAVGEAASAKTKSPGCVY